LDAHTGGLWRNLVPRPAPRSSPAGNRIAQNAMQGCVCRVLPRGPFGFDIRTFDCARCDRVHIVTVATDLVIDSRSLHARSNRNRARRWRPETRDARRFPAPGRIFVALNQMQPRSGAPFARRRDTGDCCAPSR
jgi:hypothetical protein